MICEFSVRVMQNILSFDELSKVFAPIFSQFLVYLKRAMFIKVFRKRAIAKVHVNVMKFLCRMTC